MADRYTNLFNHLGHTIPISRRRTADPPVAAATGGSAGTPRCHTQDLTLSFETGGDTAPDVTSD